MNWIDTPLLVYSRVEGHPGYHPVQEVLRQGEWGSSVLALLEVYQVLRVNYGQASGIAAAEVQELSRWPIHWEPLDLEQARGIAADRAGTGLGGADAALLLLCQEDRGTLFSLDRLLLRTARARGLSVDGVLDAATQEQVRAWEEARLPDRGLPRFLRSMEAWLASEQPEVAQRFVAATSGLTRLPG